MSVGVVVAVTRTDYPAPPFAWGQGGAAIIALVWRAPFGHKQSTLAGESPALIELASTPRTAQLARSASVKSACDPIPWRTPQRSQHVSPYRSSSASRPMLWIFDRNWQEA